MRGRAAEDEAQEDEEERRAEERAVKELHARRVLVRAFLELPAGHDDDARRGGGVFEARPILDRSDLQTRTFRNFSEHARAEHATRRKRVARRDGVHRARDAARRAVDADDAAPLAPRPAASAAALARGDADDAIASDGILF
eukprot:8166-Pelagococcus_subviridis.AAC.1